MLTLKELIGANHEVVTALEELVRHDITLIKDQDRRLVNLLHIRFDLMYGLSNA